jgi:hypothetical protein
MLVHMDRLAPYLLDTLERSLNWGAVSLSIVDAK